MVEMTILALQARILLGVGVGFMVIGIGLGYDPLTVVWRAAIAAVCAMIVGGMLLRIGARVILQVALRELDEEPEADAAGNG